MSLDPKPRTILTTDAEVAQWNQNDLPSDPVSVENGCIGKYWYYTFFFFLN